MLLVSCWPWWSRSSGSSWWSWSSWSSAVVLYQCFGIYADIVCPRVHGFTHGCVRVSMLVVISSGRTHQKYAGQQRLASNGIRILTRRFKFTPQDRSPPLPHPLHTHMSPFPPATRRNTAGVTKTGYWR